MAHVNRHKRLASACVFIVGAVVVAAVAAVGRPAVRSEQERSEKKSDGKAKGTNRDADRIMKEGLVNAVLRLEAELGCLRKQLSETRKTVAEGQVVATRRTVAKHEDALMSLRHAIEIKEIKVVSWPQDTGYDAKNWVVTIGAFKTGIGDINEFGGGPPIRAWTWVQNGRWVLEADFHSHVHHEQWWVQVIAIRRGWLIR